MKTLELFAGKQSFSTVARVMGCEVFTTDIRQLPGIDYVCDIIDFDCSLVPFVPDVIWASPDCAAWSNAAGKTHFDGRSLVPKTAKASKAFLIADKTMEIIRYFLGINPKLMYYIENPVGRLSKYYQAGTLFGPHKIPRLVRVDQCQYGREYKKPSHIFTNDFDWKPKPLCPGRPKCSHLENIKNVGSGHMTSLGRLDDKGYYKRSEIPAGLCRELLLINLKRTSHALQLQTIPNQLVH